MAVVRPDFTKKRPAPPGLAPEFEELFYSLVDEKIALSGAVTNSDLEMIGSAALAAQAEATCRQSCATPCPS